MTVLDEADSSEEEEDEMEATPDSGMHAELSRPACSPLLTEVYGSEVWCGCRAEADWQEQREAAAKARPVEEPVSEKTAAPKAPTQQV